MSVFKKGQGCSVQGIHSFKAYLDSGFEIMPDMLRIQCENFQKQICLNNLISFASEPNYWFWNA